MCGWSCHCSCHKKKLSLVLSRWRNWDIVACSTSSGSWEWTELQSAASRLSLCFTHRLSSGSRFLRFALWGATRVHVWSPAHGRWGPWPNYSFPWEFLDPMGWDWGWVPMDLYLKCRISLRGYCETHLRLTTGWVIELHSIACKVCICPAHIRPEKEPELVRDMNGLMDRWTSMSEASYCPTPLHVQWPVGQNMTLVIAPGWRWRRRKIKT